MPSPSDLAASSFGIVSKTEIEMLDQEIFEDGGSWYRVRAGKRVHYLTVQSPVHRNSALFDNLTMCRPDLLVPKLPPFPDSDWTTMRVFQGPGGGIEGAISYEPLDQIESSWHPREIEILSLKRTANFTPRVEEVEFEGRTFIAKIENFERWIPQIENETKVCQAIAKYQEPEKPPVAPAFLGHLTEQGRRIGFQLEKLEGNYASLADLPNCEAAVRALHDMGVVHGDLNRFNFIIHPSTGQARVVDFEHAEPYDEEKARVELGELKDQLTEETGRRTCLVDEKVCLAPNPLRYKPARAAAS